MRFSPDSRLDCVALACLRGDNLLFEALDFSLEAGDICQVHGANGSGKTSLLRILCGLAVPESGDVLWRGESIDRQRETFRANLSYVGHLNGVKGELTPLQNLRAVRSLAPSRGDVEAAAALERVGLYGYEEVPCRFLSAGQKRRVAIARLLLSSAQLWVLDEPVTALDADGVADFQDLLEAHAGAGGMVVITSHQPLTFGRVETKMVHL